MLKVDCVRIPVPDLETGLSFYRDRLGHQLLWRTATAAGLRLPETDAEVVIHTERGGMEVDFLVASVIDSSATLERAGGRVMVPPFDIQIGKCAVIADPFGNQLVLVDTSKGRLVTDEMGVVVDPDASSKETRL